MFITFKTFLIVFKYFNLKKKNSFYFDLFEMLQESKVNIRRRSCKDYVTENVFCRINYSVF